MKKKAIGVLIMKNYYEILELSPNASSEVIEKTYKVLAKKYHPDLQPADKKKESEEHFKLISEAYEVLSNPEKKKEYDQTLENERIRNQSQNQRQNRSTSYTASMNQEDILRKEQEEFLKNHRQQAIRQNIEYAQKKAYADVYNQTLRDMGYKLKFKKTWKDYLSILITILVLIVIFLIIWFIPYTHNLLVNLYENNKAIQILVTTVVSIFTGFWNAIVSFFHFS